MPRAQKIVISVTRVARFSRVVTIASNVGIGDVSLAM